MVAYVYEIINEINGKRYIGVSTRCDERNINEYYGSGIAIKKSIDKYGKENFTKIILEEFDSEKDARNYERKLINSLNAIDDENYYNLVAGGYGGGVKGRKLSESTRNKISESLKGHKGWDHSEDHKKYMSELMKGRKSPMKGRNQSEESRKLISDNSAKSIPVLRFSKDGEFLDEWKSAAEASRILGIHRASIGKCCRGILKSCGGYRWEFKQIK